MDKKCKDTAVVILAAGKGTRMKSDKAKVLHELNGRPMITFVVDAASQIAAENVIVVIGHQKDIVKEVVLKNANTGFAIQEKQLGTGHAVKCAMSEIEESIKSVMILCGDVPLISADTIFQLRQKHNNEGNVVTVLSVEVEDPYGYGRMVQSQSGSIEKIVEESDASDNEKEIKFINSGIYCVEKKFLKTALNNIADNNAQGEFYLTDIVEIACNENKKIGIYIGQNSKEVKGINTLDDLTEAQSLLDSKLS
jgi:UDP-N-acetylglucosamine diphosphorylase/glucosamine-1-phosphate N-acetyltransferase